MSVQMLCQGVPFLVSPRSVMMFPLVLWQLFPKYMGTNMQLITWPNIIAVKDQTTHTVAQLLVDKVISVVIVFL